MSLHTVIFRWMHNNSNHAGNSALGWKNRNVAQYESKNYVQVDEEDMKAIYSDTFRECYKGYAEPLLLTAATHQGCKKKISRSKYIRYALINQLIRDGYPLQNITSKFNDFYKAITQ